MYSSNSSTVRVTVEDRHHHKYRFYEDGAESVCDGNGDCYFAPGLNMLLTDYVMEQIRADANTEYELQGLSDQDRIAHIENVKAGDRVSLVRIPGDTEFGWRDSADYVVDVRSSDGSIGILPNIALWLTDYLFDNQNVEISAVVSKVIPASKKKRKKNKNPEVAVTIEIVVKDESGILIFTEVSELAEFLMKSVHDQYDGWDEEEEDEEEDDEEDDEDDEDDDECGTFGDEIKERKADFVTLTSRNIHNISDITRITVEREYFAAGDFADHIVENDMKLNHFAKKIIESSGEEQKKALVEMRDYINKSDSGRQGNSFGCGFEDFRYAWDGNDEKLLILADKLYHKQYLHDSHGTEFNELDVQTGKIVSYAIFDLL